MKTSKESFAKIRGVVVAGGLVLGTALGPSARAEGPQAGPASHHMNIRVQDMKWQRIFPEAGERSAEIAILHIDPTTQATELMIRVPRNAHVPKHWHTANETHTIVSGTFIIECEGKREALGPGSFNYVPSRMHHEAWTTPGEGALLFITVDGGWDVNWVNGAPRPADLTGGLEKPPR